jgi:hypothetical protein
MIGKFIASIFFVAIVQPVAASTVALDDAVRHAMHLEDLAIASLAQRKELANSLLAYWQSFEERIPRNSPETSAWLKAELSSSDNQRLNRVASSPEYALSQLLGIAENCKEISSSLVATVGLTKTKELYLWLKFTQCYSVDISTSLDQAKLSEGESDTSFITKSFGLLRHVITGKIANSVLRQAQ